MLGKTNPSIPKPAFCKEVPRLNVGERLESLPKNRPLGVNRVSQWTPGENHVTSEILVEQNKSNKFLTGTH